MAQYEIEVDSQDEFYEDSNGNNNLNNNNRNNLNDRNNSSSAPVNNQIRSVVKRKGRGFSAEEPSTQVLGDIKHFDTLREEFSGRCLRSVEGWVIFVSNLNEEVSEEEVKDKFADFGKIRDIRLNLDHRTGYVKGYALIEFEEYKEAVQAVEELDGKEWLGNRLALDFCFIKPKEAIRYNIN